jgi:putative aldouronate transport system substrate-binding protein
MSMSLRVILMTMLLVITISCNSDRSIQREIEPPYRLSIATSVVSGVDIPPINNEVQKAIEAYTNTKLDIQWLPSLAYNDKINYMIATQNMPKLMVVQYNPKTVEAIHSGLFWELGPFLDQFNNLMAYPGYYRNIEVSNKIYGIPRFRDIGRTAFLYRKDWFDKLELKQPTSLDEWYEVMKALRYDDPDGNGKMDTYGMILGKDYNIWKGVDIPLTTQLAVSIGGANFWKVDQGKFIPEFETEQYMDVIKLLRRLYEEDLINRDFAIHDEVNRDFSEKGISGMTIAVPLSAKNYHELIRRRFLNAEIDVLPMRGPYGIRLPSGTGNNGFFVIPKESVPTVDEVHQVLAFLDQMMDAPMSTLQLRGIRGKHYIELSDGKTQFIDFLRFQQEVKPYRDSFLNIEGYNVPPQKDTPLGERGRMISRQSEAYTVPNPALTLHSATFREKGEELMSMISNAQTRYIMGKISDEEWEQEVKRWRQSGGDQMINEYEEAYRGDPY